MPPVLLVDDRTEHVICADPEVLRKQCGKVIRGPQVDPEKLHWLPYDIEVKKDKFSIKNLE